MTTSSTPQRECCECRRSRQLRARGRCNTCYHRWWRSTRPSCSIKGCSSLQKARGWCEKHYDRWKTHGDPLFLAIREAGSGSIRDGYIYVSIAGVQVAQHRVVMERLLGRPLLTEETVHHKNGVRDDNRLSNLELWSSSQPPGQRIVDKVAWAKEIISMYATLVPDA